MRSRSVDKLSLSSNGDKAGRQNARFDVLVLNFQRIHLFLDNFHKLRNFDPKRDRVVVLDCSHNVAHERKLVEEFARARGWRLGGPEVVFIERQNWGIDQGARVDYLSALRHDPNPPPYIWQFQEHYLDNTSDYSRWPPNFGPLANTVKEDVIPDGAVIDLDLSEQAFTDPDVSVVFASRSGIGLLAHPNGVKSFYTDGANLGVRSSVAQRAFPPNLLDDYRLVFDASYRWALFIEFEFGRRLSHGSWFDLVRKRAFRDADEVRAAEREAGTRLSCTADPMYFGIMDRYDHRVARVRALCPGLRRALLSTAFPAICTFQTRVLPFKRKLLARKVGLLTCLRNLG